MLFINNIYRYAADPAARFKLIDIEYYKELVHRHRKINGKQMEKKFRVKYDVLHDRLCALCDCSKKLSFWNGKVH